MRYSYDRDSVRQADTGDSSSASFAKLDHADLRRETQKKKEISRT